MYDCRIVSKVVEGSATEERLSRWAQAPEMRIWNAPAVGER